MNINWSSLGQVFVVSLGVSVVVVVVFALGIVALSSRQVAGEREGAHGAVALAGAVLCFVACAAVALYGIYLIVPQFH